MKLSTVSILIIFVLGILALPTLARSPSRLRPRRRNKATAALHRQLLNMAGGDRRIIERHLAHQRKKHPAASEREHLQRIIDSWISDHNR